MTPDDYEKIRSLYSDIDGLCSRVESATTNEAQEAELRQLVQLFQDQQRAPEQIRSFLTHLGVSDDLTTHVLGEPPFDDGEEDDSTLPPI
jgi:hypothetical protein